MERVLLISPPFERFMGLSRYYYHIGLASLAGVLERANIDVLVYDADYDTNGKNLNTQELMDNHVYYEKALEDYSHPVWKEIKQVIWDYKPTVIGVSVLSVTYPSAIHLIKLAKGICPDALIVTGGVHATLCPSDLLPYSDYVMMYEGESVIVGVVKQIYKKGIVKGKRIKDLDSLPFPAINKLYKLEKYNKRDLSIIMSSRGCPRACKFCNSYNLWDCKITRKSPDYFFREILHLINDYDIHDFFITDDSFTCDKIWLMDFLKKIRPLNITWRCFSRIDMIEEEIIDSMIESGCRHVKLGIESGSPKILKKINKGITISDINKADDILKNKNINWSAYFIIGFPGECVEDIVMTQELIKRISADSITVNVYTPLPKSRLGKVKVDYKKHSFHSPNNNFTGCIDNNTFNRLVRETIQYANRQFDEHNIRSDELMGKAIDVITPAQNEEINNRECNSKNTFFVMGDRIEDFILISKKNPLNINTSMNYDLFTRDVIDSYVTFSGIDVIHNLLNEYNKEPKSNLHVKKQSFNGISSKTVSEWRKEEYPHQNNNVLKLRDTVQSSSNKDTRLYLEKHIGLSELNPTIIFNDEDIDCLKKASTVLIYNMNANYSISNTYEEQTNCEKIVSLMTNAKTIIVRTKFQENQQFTELVGAISKNEAVAKKTILLCNVNELRRGGFNIRKGVSWEQLTIETDNAIKSIANITKFKAVIVCFNHEGCMVYVHEDNKVVFKKLNYYCDEIEGDYVIKEHKRAFGPIISMQTVLAILLNNTNSESNDVNNAAIVGLMIMRKLIKLGFDGNDKKAEFPYVSIVNEIKNQEKCLINGQMKSDKGLLSEDLYGKELDNSFVIISKDIKGFVHDLVVEGPSQVKAPYLRFNNLLTFDRTEIEQLRSIYQIFKQYISDEDIKKPLSICVFGQPGSGKSFAVKQIAKMLSINTNAILEYNLSQMSNPKELSAAFHQIRDAGLKGELPLAFFDEFDSKLETDLGWLKFFLAPMQDGEFRENAVAHFIGRAIFVFAGGTCKSTEEFKQLAKDEKAKDNKLPDFLSRIKGYVDIPGPNPLDCNEDSSKKPRDCWRKSQQLNGGNSGITHISKLDKEFIINCKIKEKCCNDESHLLRRATLLRSMLQVKLGKKEGERIDIDPNVLNAFLHVTKYLHGARSLEAIIQTSDVSTSQKFTASSIFKNYLDLYVTDDFEEYLSNNISES